MRIIKLPAGPTLTFRLKDYSTMVDMHKAFKTEPLPQFAMNYPALCITAGFKSQAIKDANPGLLKALDLCKITIQGCIQNLMLQRFLFAPSKDAFCTQRTTRGPLHSDTTSFGIRWMLSLKA